MMMKSTFSLALLAGFASGAITGFSVTSVLTKGTPGHLEIKFTPGTPIAGSDLGTITFDLPASATSFLTAAAVGSLSAVASATTLNGGLAVTQVGGSGSLSYLFTRDAGSLSAIGDLTQSSGEITITFGPVTSTKAGLADAVFQIKTSEDTSQVSTNVKGVRVADALCNGAATGYGCACVTTVDPKPTFLCTDGKTCHKDGADEGKACKVVTPAGEACANTDGKTKNTKACECEATNASAVKTKYTCKADQVCDVKATTADTACKARASNGSSLLLLAAFFLAMN